MTDQKICVVCGKPFTPSKRGPKGPRLTCTKPCYEKRYYPSYYEANRERIIARQQRRRLRPTVKKQQTEHFPKRASLVHLLNGPRFNCWKFQKMPADKIVRNWSSIVRNWHRIGV